MSLFYSVVLVFIYNGHLSLSEIINCNTGENCLQTCGGTSACENDQIICPSNYQCTVNCNGRLACAETTINAAESSNLEINCNGPLDDWTCSNIVVYCPQNNQETKKCTITAGGNLFGDDMHNAHSLNFYAVNGWHDLDVIYSGNGILGDLNEQTMHCTDNYDISCQIPVGSWTCDNNGDLTCNNPPTSTTTLDPTTMNPTSMTPTTSNPTTLLPTPINPTTNAPTTSNPTTTQSTTSEPSMLPTTSNPTTTQPTSVNPTTLAPTSMNPTTVSPTTMNPTYMTPTTSNPTTSAPTIMTSTISNPTTLAPTSMKPTTSNPTNVLNEYEGNGTVTDALSTISDVNDYVMEGNKSFIDNYLWILYVFVTFIFILVVFIIFVVWKRTQRKREKIRSEGNMHKSQRSTISDTVTVEGDGNIVMHSQAIGEVPLVRITSTSASDIDDIEDMYIITKTKGWDTKKGDGDCDNDNDDMYDNKPTSGSETMGNVVTKGNV